MRFDHGLLAEVPPYLFITRLTLEEEVITTWVRRAQNLPEMQVTGAALTSRSQENLGRPIAGPSNASPQTQFTGQLLSSATR